MRTLQNLVKTCKKWNIHLEENCAFKPSAVASSFASGMFFGLFKSNIVAVREASHRPLSEIILCQLLMTLPMTYTTLDILNCATKLIEIELKPPCSSCHTTKLMFVQKLPLLTDRKSQKCTDNQAKVRYQYPKNAQTINRGFIIFCNVPANENVLFCECTMMILLSCATVGHFST